MTSAIDRWEGVAKKLKALKKKYPDLRATVGPIVLMTQEEIDCVVLKLEDVREQGE